MVHKIVEPTLDRIAALTTPQILKLEVDHDLLNGYEIAINKEKAGYSANISFKPHSGFISSQLHSIDLPLPIRLTNSSTTYHLPENSILLNQRNFYDSLNEVDKDPVIRISGSISQLSSGTTESAFDGKYLRLVIPVTASHLKLREIRGFHYTTDLQSNERHLLKVNINSHEYNFFSFATKGGLYLAVDSTIPTDIKQFKILSHSILLALGFLYGDLYLDEGFILSSAHQDFSQIENISFSTYRESILTGLRIHTTNAYSIHNLTGKNREEIDARLKDAQSWVNEIIEFPPETFSKLCELFYNSEPTSRAAIVTLQGNMLALELKGSAYSIALEAITAVIMEQNHEKKPKPVDKVIFNQLKQKMLSALDEILPPTEENKAARSIFTNRVDNLNSPTNTSKLQKAFGLVDYDLNDYEKDALKARDTFQHGDLPVSEYTENEAFREVYNVCLIMHRLIYILVLKQINYSGYIINYPQLHSQITKKSFGEKLFYKVG